MTTYVQRAVTEVTAAPEPAPVAAGGDAQQPEPTLIRRMLARLRCLEMRTRAQGFDD